MPYDNNNSGTLGKNKRKEKDTHPDYSGKAVIDGKGYWISAWLKTAGPNAQIPGEKFFSLAFKPRDPQPQPTPASTPPPSDPVDEDVPF